MKIIKLIPLALIFLITNTVSAENLSVGKTYKLETDFSVKEVNSTGTTDRSVGAKSKFKVLNVDDSGRYTIKFSSVWQPVSDTFECIDCTLGMFCEHSMPAGNNTCADGKGNLQRKLESSMVSENRTYFIEKNPATGVKVEQVSKLSTVGPTSGPLIIPFKFRTKDKSLTGEATLGWYAGWGFDLKHFVLEPFGSIGLTQISLSKLNENNVVENNTKSGVTYAGGFFIRNWDKVNIGIVGGKDRIGDQSWEYEGDTWVSISIGLKVN